MIQSLLLLTSTIIAIGKSDDTDSIESTASGFVTTDGINYMLNGNKYRFCGTNNYYLPYSSQFMVDNVLETAAKNGFDIIRTWGFIDIGYPNGSDCADDNYPLKDGLYFQYFDDSIKGPNFNDTNLIHLDYAIYKASQLGIKLLITLTNNWSDFGGMDQYIIWKKLSNSTYNTMTAYHDDFYNDQQIREWYKNWIKHLLNRKNTYNNIKYMNDLTIFSWELANEPRCQGSGAFQTSTHCTINYAIYGKQPIANTTTNWVKEMSKYIKSIDSNHMIGVGDEGWYCWEYQACPDTVCDCYYGIDTIALINITTIDYLTIHLYPDQWGKTSNWGNIWISNHTTVAHNANKPMLLGEYGATGSDQHNIYKEWTNTVYSNDTNGDLFWMISGRNDPGSTDGYWVPNYDGYAVYCPNSTEPSTPGDDPASCDTLAAHAAQMANS